MPAASPGIACDFHGCRGFIRSVSLPAVPPIGARLMLDGMDYVVRDAVWIVAEGTKVNIHVDWHLPLPGF